MHTATPAKGRLSGIALLERLWRVFVSTGYMKLQKVLMLGLNLFLWELLGFCVPANKKMPISFPHVQQKRERP